MMLVLMCVVGVLIVRALLRYMYQLHAEYKECKRLNDAIKDMSAQESRDSSVHSGPTTK